MAVYPAQDYLKTIVAGISSNYSVGSYTTWNIGIGSLNYSQSSGFSGIRIAAGNTVTAAITDILSETSTSKHYSVSIPYGATSSYTYINILCRYQGNLRQMLSIKRSVFGGTNTIYFDFDYDHSTRTLSNMVMYTSSGTRYTWDDIYGPIATWNDIGNEIIEDSFSDPTKVVIANGSSGSIWNTNTGKTRTYRCLIGNYPSQTYTANQGIRFADLDSIYESQSL